MPPVLEPSSKGPPTQYDPMTEHQIHLIRAIVGLEEFAKTAPGGGMRGLSGRAIMFSVRMLATAVEAIPGLLHDQPNEAPEDEGDLPEISEPSPEHSPGDLRARIDAPGPH